MNRFSMISSGLAGAVAAVFFVQTASAADTAFSSGAMQPKRDPFTPSMLMYAAVGQQAAQAPGGYGFIPSAGIDQVPKMRLRGFVNDDPEKSVALLEVEGAGVYLVRSGDEIGLQAIGRNTVLKIVAIDGQSIKVQTGMINQVIVVR